MVLTFPFIEPSPLGPTRQAERSPAGRSCHETRWCSSSCASKYRGLLPFDPTPTRPRLVHARLGRGRSPAMRSFSSACSTASSWSSLILRGTGEVELCVELACDSTGSPAGTHWIYSVSACWQDIELSSHRRSGRFPIVHQISLPTSEPSLPSTTLLGCRYGSGRGSPLAGHQAGCAGDPPKLVRLLEAATSAALAPNPSLL